MDGVYSEWAHVKSGVPQGSVHGPILFVLYINDMPKVVENTCKLFADDAKLSGKATNSVSIQNELNNLTEWSLTWQLSLTTVNVDVSTLENLIRSMTM